MVVARRVTFELFEQGKVELIDELTTRDFVNQGQTTGPTEGREKLKNAILRTRSAFPDFSYRLEHEVVDGDIIVHHLIAHGTNRGSLLGFPPTGNEATWRGMHLMRFVGGRVSEQWGIVDRLGVLQQLGLFSGAPKRTET